MSPIYFVTGNDRKVAEAQDACKDYAITIKKTPLDIDEIQHHDPIQISLHKARQAYTRLKKPIVINDTSWHIPALKGFPGGYMKDMIGWLEPEDFIALIKDKTDRRIHCIETTVYKDAEEEKVFHKSFDGEMSLVAKGSGNSIEQVAMFGGKTIGELRDEGKFAFSRDDVLWTEFAQWYSTRD